MKINQYKHLTFIFLPLMYLAGSIGLQIPQTKMLFEILIPFNLVASLALLLWFHEDWNSAFIKYACVTFLVGFGVEVLGVRTGLIFGHYQYGKALGFGFWGVPLTIGCNWLMLNYCVNTIADKLKASIFTKITVAAFLMTALDYIIEPTAIYLGFWNWENGIIPFKNYVAWFLVSFVISTIYFYSNFKRKNALALLFFCLQICFFVSFKIALFLKK